MAKIITRNGEFFFVEEDGREYPPTDEQKEIVRFVKSSQANLLIEALAGAAKTSTLELIAAALPGRPILSVAFNKKIAEEMAKRLPGHCVAKTLNSIGHTAWGQSIGKPRLTLDKGKMGGILKGFQLPRWQKEELRESFGDVVQLASRSKLMGYVPEGRYEEAVHLVSRQTLEDHFADAEYPAIAWDLLDQMLIQSIKLAYAGTIDFDDQIYMSCLFGAQMPRFPTVLADEAQDFSPLNHYMVQLLVGDRRLIAVGDSCQSIYAFRGAVSDSMSVLRQRFQMETLGLSISFRCPKAVVQLARKRAPQMQWPEWAAEGEIHDLAGAVGGKPSPWGPNDIPAYSAVICRNNAPLFSLGLKLLKAGRGITLQGMDISKKLIKILAEFGDRDMPREELLGHLDRWRSAKTSEAKLKPETIEDRYACLAVFAEATPSLGAAIAHAEALFAAEGPIKLLSGHKSKGLEWDHVFHLDPWRVPSAFAKSPEELIQEDNLEYVITTRAKKSLTFINMDQYDEEMI